MSTDSKKKRQRPATPTPSECRPPRSGRWRKRRRLTIAGIVILGLVLLVALLPTIIAHTPLMAYFVRRAAMLDGTITFHSASVGWFSSASVSGIEIRDAQGETVLEADSLTCDRSLLKLLFNSSNVGTLRIEKPRLNAKLTRDGSNVEAVLARWLTGPSSSSNQGVDLSVEVADGEVTIVDQETQQSWHVTALQFALDMSRQLAWPTRMEGAATVDDRGHAGQPGLEVASEGQRHAAGRSGGLVRPGGHRRRPQPANHRAAAGHVPASGRPRHARAETRRHAGLESRSPVDRPRERETQRQPQRQRFVLSSRPSLGRDVIRLAKVQASCKAARQDKQLTVEEAKIDCDVGNLAASGHVDLGERGLESLTDLLRQPDCAVQGTLDLAQLARLLPGTLRVRPGTEITSGQVQLTVRTTNPAAGPLPGSAPTPPPPPWHGRPGWKPITSRRPIMAGSSPGTSPYRSTSPSIKPIKGR